MIAVHVDALPHSAAKLPVVPRLGDALRARSYRLDRAWDALWRTSAHVFALTETTGAAATIDLGALESALQEIDFAPLLPVTLTQAVRRRQLSFLGGRLSAERALAQIGWNAAGPERGADGEPLWPVAVRGSITHTDACAHAVVLEARQCGGVGIDSERVVASCESIVAVCCTPFERRTWFAADDQLLRATLLFSAKESFYKAIYPIVQRFVDFDEVEAVSWDDAHAEILLQPTATSDLSRLIDSAHARYRIDVSAQACVHTAVLLPSTSSTPCQ